MPGQLQRLEKKHEIGRDEGAHFEEQLRSQLAQMEAMQSTKTSVNEWPGHESVKKRKQIRSEQKLNLDGVNGFIQEHGKLSEEPRRLYAILDEFEFLGDARANLTYGGVNADYMDDNIRQILEDSSDNNFDNIYRELPIYLLDFSA